MWQRHLHGAYQQTKKIVGRAYDHTVKFAGQLDHAFNIGKRIYGALQPAIQDIGGSNFNRSVMEGIGAYESGRNRALGGYNMVQAYTNQLRRQVPELEL